MAARKKSDLTYSQAKTELEAILEQIERGSIDIDVLAERVERAAELIRACRETLSGTELRVTKIVDDLAADATERATSGEEG
jgi:exodeoxyribonuclease VII small subunit